MNYIVFYQRLGKVVNNNVETMDYTKEYTNIHSIDVDVASVELEIQLSDKLKIEGTDIPSDYKFEEQNGVLKIKNKKVSQNSKLVMYIPSNIQKLDIDIGAGKIQMQDIMVNRLNLDTGAAIANIENVIVLSAAEIDAGIGEIKIQNSDISNLDMDAGVGNVKYDGYLRETSKIDCGVGNIDINLKGTGEIYKIIAERGVGELKINGNKLSGTQTIGNGSNILKISGGIGSLSVTY